MKAEYLNGDNLLPVSNSTVFSFFIFNLLIHFLGSKFSRLVFHGQEA